MEGDDALMVTVSVFRAGDGRTGEERLAAAARLAGYREMDEKETAPGELPAAPACAAERTELWQIARTERGKPYFPNRPEVHFSISHSGELWVCAFSGRPVGVDVQQHVKKRGEGDREAAGRFGRMADRFFHPREAVWVREEPYERFFRIWTAKESYVKYTGEGIGAGFSQFSTAPEARRPGPGEPVFAGAADGGRGSEKVRFFSTRIDWDDPAGRAFCGEAFFGEASFGEVSFGPASAASAGGLRPPAYTLCVCYEDTEGPVRILYFDEISDN